MKSSMLAPTSMQAGTRRTTMPRNGRLKSGAIVCRGLPDASGLALRHGLAGVVEKVPGWVAVNRVGG